MTTISEVSDAVASISECIDAYNVDRPAEAATWARVAKVAEESGEVIAAYIGATGQNPRKGTTHSQRDLEEELLDVALTALAALEHLRGHDRRSGAMLADKADRTLARLRALAGSTRQVDGDDTRAPGDSE